MIPLNCLGIGVDIISISRVKQAIEEFGEEFLKQKLTNREINQCRNKSDYFASISARLAAKEAFYKALGTGLSNQHSWDSIEILNGKWGNPSVHFVEDGFSVSQEQLLVSLSHETDYAIAFVVIQDR